MSEVPHLNLIYDPQWGVAIRDGEVELHYKQMLAYPFMFTSDKTTHRTSSMLVITRFRVGVVEGECTLNLIYNDITYPVDTQGHVEWWDEVPDYNIDFLLRISNAT